MNAAGRHRLAGSDATVAAALTPNAASEVLS
jgi:hypothetical protein